jgi:hypothetical protein
MEQTRLRGNEPSYKAQGPHRTDSRVEKCNADRREAYVEQNRATEYMASGYV